MRQFLELFMGVHPQNRALAGIQADSISKDSTNPSPKSMATVRVGPVAMDIARYGAGTKRFSKLFVGVHP